MNDTVRRADTADAFLAVPGEMAALMRRHDWSRSPLGRPETWPESLRSVTRLMLQSLHPMFVAWGPDLAFLYNDAYRPLLGAKHPASLGRPFETVWSDIWKDIQPIVSRALAGEAIWFEDLHLRTERHGYPEDAWYTFSYSPAHDETGTIAGLFCACTETTGKVAAERALRAERDRVQSILDSMAEAFVLLDREFRVIEINGEALRLEPRLREEMVGRTHWELWPGSESSEIGDLYRRAMAERVPVSLDHHYLWEDGSDAWLEMRAYPSGSDLAIFYRDVTERKRAEEQLRESEAHHRHTVELNPQVVWTAEPEGQLDRVAKRWFDWTGTSGLGATWGQAMHPDDLDRSMEVWKRSVTTGEPYDIEHRVRLRGGEHHWMRSRAFPRRDEQGRIVKWYGATEDIHERKTAELALQKTRMEAEALAAERAALLNQLAEGVIVTDPEGRITFVNEAATRIHGVARLDVPPEEYTSTYRLLTEEGRPYPPEELPLARAVLRGETVTEARWRIARPDGTQVLAVGSARPVTGPDGAQMGAVLTLRDDTERAARERELRESEARLRALTDNLPAGMVYQLATQADGSARRFVYVSQSHERLTGVPAQAALDDPYVPYNLVLPEHREALAAAEAISIRDLTLFSAEVPFRRADTGEVRWCRIISAPRVLPDGSLIWDGLQIDVTEQKQAEETVRELNRTLEHRVAQAIAEREQAEEQLRQAQKMEAVGQLTGGIAHDFNNLLQIVTGNLDILGRNLPEDAGRLRRLADNAMVGAKRAATLTQRLLAFSRRQPLDPKPINVNTLVSGMSDLLGRTLGETIEIETVLAGGLWRVEADPNQLESALLNLAVNARDAMPAGGKLTIETQNAHLDHAYASHTAEVTPGQYVVICVSDTGSGIEAATMIRVFEPFFTTKEVGKGTGLGLSQVYGFVKQSGGHVKIYSEEGEGTTVKIYLPRRLAAETPETLAVEPPVPEGTRAETIVVVEDDGDVRAFSVEVLRELGYRILEAQDGPSALRLLERHEAKIDLLFTDVVLPKGLTGADLAARAQVLRPGLKVLFTTGYARNAIVHHGRLDAGVELITKPFGYADLAARIREVLDS